ncbi:MAG: hypothetical protein JWN14_4813 [Chthonomonadales bacterium]|nr:hypothetical protein [Chthonomonadales bacterium]
MFLASMFMLTAACAFVAPMARAENEGDYNATTIPEWWWKYVHPGDPHPTWTKYIDISEVLVDKGVINPRTQDMTNTVVFTFTNRSAQTVECDGSVSILHTIRNNEGSIVSREELLPARLPKALKVGESVKIVETAFTPAKLRGYMEFLDVAER